MKTKLELIGTVLVFLLVSLPVSAQVIEPGDAEEKEAFVERQLSTGLAAKEPIEFIEWFVTEDGKRTMVSKKNGDVVLDDSTYIVDAIPAKNGIVYIINESLDS